MFPTPQASTPNRVALALGLLALTLQMASPLSAATMTGWLSVVWGDRMVIIHEVQAGRSEPAWVVDEDDPPANYADTEGVMWRVGEMFVDPAAEILVEVESLTATGFEIDILLGASLFRDGFESGSASAWTTSVP